MKLLRCKLAENGYQKINEFSWEDNTLNLERLFKRSLIPLPNELNTSYICILILLKTRLIIFLDNPKKAD